MGYRPIEKPEINYVPPLGLDNRIVSGNTALITVVNSLITFSGLTNAGVGPIFWYTGTSGGTGSIRSFSGDSNILFTAASGDTIGIGLAPNITVISLSALTVSADTLYSGTTALSDIINNISLGNQTHVQPGTNIQTGGTAQFPIISTVDSPIFNNLTASGASVFNTVNANIITGSTFFSGSTPLQTVIQNLIGNNSSGFITGATNIGTGNARVYKQTTNNNLELRSFSGGNQINITSGDTHLVNLNPNVSISTLTATTINATTLSAGTIFSGSTPLQNLFVTDGANLGGNSVFVNKVGSILRFKGLNPGTNISITSAGNYLTINNTATYSTLWQTGAGAYSLRPISPTPGNTYGDYSIIAGYNNYISTGARGSISMGGSNDIGLNSQYASILGGRSNTIEDNTTAASIVGGDGNLIKTTNSSSFIGAGFGNQILTPYTTHASIVGGKGNKVGYLTTSSYSSIIGGIDNLIGLDTISKYSAIIGGKALTCNISEMVVVPDLRIANFAYGGGYSYMLVCNGSGYVSRTSLPTSPTILTLTAGANISILSVGTNRTISTVANPIFNTIVTSGATSRMASLSATTLSGGTIFSGNTNIGQLFSHTGHTHQFSTILNTAHTHSIGEIINLQSNLDTKFAISGGTFTGPISGTSISATTFYSGSTDLSNLFATQSQVAGLATTHVQNGINTFTGGTALAPTVNVTALTISNITSSGSAIFNSLSSTTISGGTLYSGNTELSIIFSGANLWTAGPGPYSLKAGQNNNFGNAEHAFMFGEGGLIASLSTQNTILNGLYNTINSSYCSILGGISNTVNIGSNYSLIGIGKGHLIYSNTPYGVILGGYLNRLSGASSSIISGRFNYSLSSRPDAANTILGGYFNRIFGSQNYSNSVLGGKFNSIGDITNIANLNSSVIVGGAYNKAYVTGTLICGGKQNASFNTYYSTVVGGFYNTIGEYGGAQRPGSHTILGGTNGQINVGGKYSLIGQGFDNNISSVQNYNLITNGKSNRLFGQGAIINSSFSTIPSGLTNSVIIAISGFTANASNRVYVPSIKVNDLTGTTASIAQVSTDGVLQRAGFSIDSFKSSGVTFSAFTGSPLKYTVVFPTFYANDNFTVAITSNDVRTWSVDNLTLSGFTINSNSNTAMTGRTMWQTQPFYNP